MTGDKIFDAFCSRAHNALLSSANREQLQKCHFECVKANASTFLTLADDTGHDFSSLVEIRMSMAQLAHSHTEISNRIGQHSIALSKRMLACERIDREFFDYSCCHHEPSFFSFNFAEICQNQKYFVGCTAAHQRLGCVNVPHSATYN